MAENSSWNYRQTDGKNMVWFEKIERKFAKLSKTTFIYRSSFLLFCSLQVIPFFIPYSLSFPFLILTVTVYLDIYF
jgi:hypothetical protein